MKLRYVLTALYFVGMAVILWSVLFLASVFMVVISSRPVYGGLILANTPLWIFPFCLLALLGRISKVRECVDNFMAIIFR
jgi:hypothetical protein